MASVTQVIPNYLGGVSKQTDNKKKPGQVRECLNAYPDPTLGLMKRPGFKFIKDIHTSSNPSSPDYVDAKWFYINRDEDEVYVGNIASNRVRIWNVSNTTNGNGTECTVHDNTYSLTLTGNGSSGATNQRNLAVTNVSSSGSGMTVNVVADGGVVTSVHVCTTGTGYAASDTLKVAAANSTASADITFTLASLPSAHYLNTTRDNYDVLTVQDNSIITNKTKVVTTQDVPTNTTEKQRATVFITQVKYATKYQVKLNGTLVGDYTTIAEEASGATVLVNTVDKILTELKNDIEGAGYTVDKHLATLEISKGSDFTIETTDDQGGVSIRSFREQVANITQLPSQSNHGRIVQVINTASTTEDSYYSEFIAENTTYNADGTVNVAGSGAGYWQEARAWNASPGLNAETMPHELGNSAQNVFSLSRVAWNERESGIEGEGGTNADPSFVGTTIQQAFFNNNRLGFLTQDSVVMSKSLNFYNFFRTSALLQTDADPIDLNCSSIRPAVLHGVIPTAQGLILFSKNQQFIMFSDSEVLTPSSTVIRGISNYEMDAVIDPVDVGTSINFISKTASYTRVFGMNTRGSEENPLIFDVGKIVTEWIPETITNLISSPQNSMIAMYGHSTGSPTMYIYKTYTVGEKNIMQTWVKWDFPGDIQFSSIDSDLMWSVVENKGVYALISASLTQTPEDAIVVTNAGQRINPYMDLYAKASSVVYDSSDPANTFSKCYLPYADIDTFTPIVILKGDVSATSWGSTQSGFTLSPERGTDGTGDYFKVLNKDWSGIANDVYVGYKYNYDVELPKTYFKLDPEGEVLDYTAALTIARMKFAVGLSSVVGFKLKSKGYRGPSAERTGDGSTTAFSVPFPLKEENGITVKLDGAKQASSTYSVTTSDTQATVTFGTAPTAASTTGNVTTPAQKIEITTDTWYDVQPVQDANDYLADDVPLVDESIFTVPIHQRTDNFNMRVFSNSPFPVSITSMMWEGNYSPRYYRRT